jgi:flavin reductase (DIM6/NTAB) family NADH-FMN oxidoreductase RutF
MVIFGEVVLYQVEESVLDEKGLVDAAKLRPLARLGASYFAGLGKIFRASESK